MSASLFPRHLGASASVTEHDLRYATTQERNKILAADVARLLALSTAETLEYIDRVVAVGQWKGDAGIRTQVQADFSAAGIAVSDARLKLCMDALMVEAWQVLRLRSRDDTRAPAVGLGDAGPMGRIAPSRVFSLSIGQSLGAGRARGSGALH